MCIRALHDKGQHDNTYMINTLTFLLLFTAPQNSKPGGIESVAAISMGDGAPLWPLLRFGLVDTAAALALRGVEGCVLEDHEDLFDWDDEVDEDFGAIPAAQKAAATPVTCTMLDLCSRDMDLPFSGSWKAMARLLDIAILTGNQKAAVNLSKKSSFGPCGRLRGLPGRVQCLLPAQDRELGTWWRTALHTFLQWCNCAETLLPLLGWSLLEKVMLHRGQKKLLKDANQIQPVVILITCNFHQMNWRISWWRTAWRRSFSTNFVSAVEVGGLAGDPPSVPTVQWPLETKIFEQFFRKLFLLGASWWAWWWHETVTVSRQNPCG